jgi:hypothetical protein
MHVRGMKPTQGIGAVVDVRRAAVERMADEDHAKHGAEYIGRMVQRDRENSLRARAARAAAAIARRLGMR